MKTSFKNFYEKLNKLQQTYYVGINNSAKDNQNLRGILKNYIEKFIYTKKKLNKLNHMKDHHNIDINFHKLNEFEQTYVSKSIDVSEMEKKLYNNLLSNILEKRKDELKATDDTKTLLLSVLKAALAKVSFNDIKNTDTKNLLLYLNGKYQLIPTEGSCNSKDIEVQQEKGIQNEEGNSAGLNLLKNFLSKIYYLFKTN